MQARPPGAGPGPHSGAGQPGNQAPFAGIKAPGAAGSLTAAGGLLSANGVAGYRPAGPQPNGVMPPANGLVPPAPAAYSNPGQQGQHPPGGLPPAAGLARGSIPPPGTAMPGQGWAGPPAGAPGGARANGPSPAGPGLAGGVPPGPHGGLPGPPGTLSGPPSGQLQRLQLGGPAQAPGGGLAPARASGPLSGPPPPPGGLPPSGAPPPGDLRRGPLFGPPPPGQPAGPPGLAGPAPAGPPGPPGSAGRAPLGPPGALQPRSFADGPSPRPAPLQTTRPPSFGPGQGPPAPAAPPAFGFQQSGPHSPPPYMIGMPRSPGSSPLPGGSTASPTPPSRFGPPPPGSMAPPAFGGSSMQPPLHQAPLQRQPSAASRIDPAQIPRPSPTVDDEETMVVFETRLGGQHNTPPLSTTRFVVRDTGNCSPRCMRSTLNQVPCTRDMLALCHMPFAVVIQPFALPEPGDDAVQTVDFGPTGPLRCGRCKAYVNPFMRWIENGQKFACNFCGHATECPSDYFCHLGPDGRRRDADDRPELSKGSVEFVATQEYMVRPPLPPAHLFLIDVSYNAVSSGATAATCAAIVAVLDEVQGGEQATVGIVTFDTTLHFYSCRPGQSAPQMMVVPDVNEVYCPLSASVVAPLQAARSLLDTLLESIPRMFAATQVADAAAGAALEAAIQVLKGGAGGRVHAFLTQLPKVGAHALAARDQLGAVGEREPLAGLAPAGKDFQALAEQAAEAQVSIDLFLLAGSFMDVATLGRLPGVTGGQLYTYIPFAPALDADQLLNDLRWNLLRPQGWEALARLRCSAGLTVERYLGAFHQRTPTDLDLPAISADHALVALLRHEDKLPEQSEVYLQFAILFTTCDGQRRIRVHTLGLPTTAVLGTTYRGADLEAQLNVMARTLSPKVAGAGVAAARDAVQAACVDVLHTYRKHCATKSSSGQLILPEALKLLPLYALALMKAPPLRTDTRLDVRATWLARLASLGCARTVALVHPRLLALHHLLAPPGTHALVGALPHSLQLSAAQLQPDGIYLLENGFDAAVLFGKDVPRDTLRQLLGTDEVEQATKEPGRPMALPRFDTTASRAVHAALDEVRRQRGAYLSLRVLKRGDPGEAAFHLSLVEDRSAAGASYVEFLCAVHRAIQSKFQ